jgi:hypothetical protein
MTFQQGKSGNPGGQSRLKHLTDDLRKVVAQNPAKVRKISEYILEQAEAGELPFIQFLYDRLEGKAAQTLDVTHDIQNLDPTERLSTLLRRQASVIDLEPLALKGPAER